MNEKELLTEEEVEKLNEDSDFVIFCKTAKDKTITQNDLNIWKEILKQHVDDPVLNFKIFKSS